MTKAAINMSMGATKADQPAAHGLGHFANRDALAAGCALAGEFVVVFLALRTGVSAGTILAIHAAIAAWTWLILFSGRPRHEDATIAAVILLLVTVAGPAGALAAAIMLPMVGKAGAGPDVLDAWYKRLREAGGVDPATALHDRVAAGRVLRLEAPPPSNFLDVIANGTLEERQTALGLMARRFHPDFAPALEAALRSPEPVVRVQAAAVVAHVRSDLKTKIAALLAGETLKHAAASRNRLSRACLLRSLSACSLVEEGDRARCRTEANRLLNETLPSARDIARACTASRPGTVAAIESFLIECGRFKDFRIARRASVIAAGGAYRVRFVRPTKAVP